MMQEGRSPGRGDACASVDGCRGKLVHLLCRLYRQKQQRNRAKRYRIIRLLCVSRLLLLKVAAAPRILQEIRVWSWRRFLLRRLATEDGHEATTEHHSHIAIHELTGALHTDDRIYHDPTVAKKTFRQSLSWSRADELKLIPPDNSRMSGP